MMSVGFGVLFLMVGASVDYMNGTQAQQKLQTIADRALLEAVVSGESDVSKLQTMVNASLAEYSPTATGRIEFFGENNENVRIITTDTKPLLIMGAFGFEDQKISALAESVVPTGGLKLNLAMVLDTTGSMADFNRITNLRTAAVDLVNTIEQSVANPGDVQISVVPFADYVRIDPSNRGASWLEIQSEDPITYDVLDGDNSVNCTSGTGENASTVCDSYAFVSVTETLLWQGCMGSRRNGDHLIPEYAGRQFQGVVNSHNCNGHYNILMPLTDNFTQVKQAIQSLDTRGDTYIPAGLAWAWRTLDFRLPFDESKFSNPQETQNVLLLMTDGGNSVTLNGIRPDFNGIYHWGRSGPVQLAEDKEDANNITLTLCDDIKASDIKIITIAYEVTDSDTLELLRNCASAPDDFINAATGAQLQQAFADVGRGLSSEIRLTR